MALNLTDEQLQELGRPAKANKRADQIALIDNLDNEQVLEKIHNRLYDSIYDLPDYLVRKYLNESLEERINIFDYCLFILPSDKTLQDELGLLETDLSHFTKQDLENHIELNYKGNLTHYQTKGTAFLLASEKCLLGDECGLGKTVMVSATLKRLKEKNNLFGFIVCCESSACKNWQRELVRFAGLNTIIVDSNMETLEKLFNGTLYSEKALENIDGIIIKHSLLTKGNIGLYKLADFNTFVLDESSVIKTESTKSYECVETLLRYAKPQYVFMLNATAFELIIEDLYNQFKLLDESLFKSKNWVEERFCKTKLEKVYYRGGGGNYMHKRVIVGYKNTDQFRSRLKYFYLARTRKDLGVISHNKCYCRIFEKTVEQQKGIRLEDGMWNEVLNCPSMCKSNRFYHKPNPNIKLPIELATFRLPFDKDNLPKLSGMLDLVETKLREGKRHIVIYCWHKEACDTISDLINKEFGATYNVRADILNGKTTNKQEKIDDFNEDRTQILVTNVAKSVNLSIGEVCIFYSIVTNPARLLQISSRINRDTSGREREYYCLLYRGEEVKGILNAYKRLQNKQKLLGGLEDSANDILTACYEEIKGTTT